MTYATDLIAAERARQIEQEGYNAEHDEGHAQQLIEAGKRYAGDAEFMLRGGHPEDGNPWVEDAHMGPTKDWPWHEDYYKPGSDPMQTLVKAGALIAAAIDSLVSAGA
jgi:hypothetical protein